MLSFFKETGPRDVTQESYDTLSTVTAVHAIQSNIATAEYSKQPVWVWNGLKKADFFSLYRCHLSYPCPQCKHGCLGSLQVLIGIR